MASFLLKFHEALKPILTKQTTIRRFTRGIILNNEDSGIDETEPTNEIKIHPSKDRRKLVPVETSIRYLESEAFKETYGLDPVWKPYRRNHKGQIPPRKTRKTCVRAGIITTGNPCPICRDEYLILDHRNTKLLKQFISEHNGDVISYKKTGICQRQHNRLLVAVYRAKDYGTITFDVPIRQYDYSDWYKPTEISKST